MARYQYPHHQGARVLHEYLWSKCQAGTPTLGYLDGLNMEEMKRDTELSQTSLHRAMAVLEADGKVKRHKSRGRGNTNRYEVTPPTTSEKHND